MISPFVGAASAHWSDQYIGQPFHKDGGDCFYWYRRIAREQFGRTIPPMPVNPRRHARSAMELLGDPSAPGRCGYVPTDTPIEGDAVFLSRGDEPHHLGMVIDPGDGQLWVLHALEGSGVISQPIYTLSREGWNILGYYTYAQ